VNGEDDDSEQTTALIRREALLGLIDRTSAPEPAYVRTVPRDQKRSGKGVEVVDVSALQPLPARRQRSAEGEGDLGRVSPLLVWGIITLLIVTFIAATQLR
jgi:hypothetical protein